jgi:hypothetical protein
LLSDLSIYSGILPIIMFFLFLDRNKKGGLWVIFFYVLVSFANDLLLNYLLLTPSVYFYFYSFFTILEYSFFTAFLFINIKISLLKKIVLIVSALFYIFCIYTLLSTKDYKFDSLTASIEAILIIIYCILFFYEQINHPDVSFIYSSKKFWITTAFLLYLSGTLFLFIYTSDISENAKLDYWPINYVCNIIKNLIITLAFYIPTSQSQPFVHDDFFEKPPLTHYKH